MTSATISDLIVPPAEYPYPDWAPPGDTFHVPEHIRADYAACQIPPNAEADYWRNGAVTVVSIPHEAAIARAQRAGRLQGDLVTDPRDLMVHADDSVSYRSDHNGANARFTVTATVKLEGRTGYPEWLHLRRLDRAQAALDARAAQARLREQHTCGICGVFDAAPRTLTLPDLPAARVCGECGELIAHRHRERFTISGRPRGDLVDAWLNATGGDLA
ncbi:hypothetical protein ACLQ2Q_20720 [Microbacterium sp. DT81.1]|uniref:hypothetical protein n=1 Tax=Microbacterium sp. DT81.1 TaxID=3393413 RepID=UPI003CE6B465